LNEHWQPHRSYDREDESVKKTAPIAAVISFAIGGLFAAPAANAAQGTGCPTGFALEPVSVLGTNFVGIADNVNHDGFICLKTLNSGAGLSAVFIDNTAP
jgi:hypothetical protein